MPRIPRTTTVGSLKTYRYDLNRSTYTMNQSMNKVITQRNFNSFAEDPTAASRAFQLRRAYLRTSTQETLNTSVYSKYQQAWKALDSVSQDVDTVADDTAFGSILRSLNGPDASGRNALGQSMVAKADSIIQTMNGRYGENFLFSGADTLNVPFTWVTNENRAYIDPATAKADNPDHAAAFQYVVKNTGLTPEQETKWNEWVENGFPKPEDDDYADFTAMVTLTNDEKAATEAGIPKENPKFDQDYTWYIDNGRDENGNVLATPYTPEELAEAQADPRYGKYVSESGPNTNEVVDGKTVKTPVKNPAYDANTQYKYLQADGKTGTNDISKAGRVLCFRGVRMDTNLDDATLDAEQMSYFLRDETKYMDLGIGHKELNGEVVPTSVFDASLQGGFYLGGSGTSTQTVTIRGETREIEVPNDIVSIIDQMGNVLLRCDPDNGAYASEDDEFYSLALARQFEDQAKVVKQRYDELDTRSSYLRDNGELLIAQADTLSEQFMGLEDVDPAAAISDFMYAKYCYDTALKVGNSILSQSLMDYLNL